MKNIPVNNMMNNQMFKIDMNKKNKNQKMMKNPIQNEIIKKKKNNSSHITKKRK
jgi:hypothetical protein